MIAAGTCGQFIEWMFCSRVSALAGHKEIQTGELRLTN